MHPGHCCTRNTIKKYLESLKCVRIFFFFVIKTNLPILSVLLLLYSVIRPSALQKYIAKYDFEQYIYINSLILVPPVFDTPFLLVDLM